jgi:MFS transporter, PAT family, beta-lactamase induction signal transducer AmpG
MIRTYLAMGLMGFGSGLPLLMVSTTLAIYLREQGLTLTAIGLYSYVLTPYAVKFLWAPILDSYRVPLLGAALGLRRSWILVAQIGVAAMLIVIPALNVRTAMEPLALAALLCAFLGATQDIAVDSWRIEAAGPEQQGVLTAIYQIGYRVALIAAGAGALAIAELWDWTAAYRIMAGLMMAASLGVLIAPAAAEKAAATANLLETFVVPLREILQRTAPVIVPLVAFILLYRLPDFLFSSISAPFYIDQGYTKLEIAGISKVYGVLMSIGGAMAGGVVVANVSLRTALVLGVVLASASNLAFVSMALGHKGLLMLAAAITADNFAAGFAGTVFIAYLSRLTSLTFAASQYALLSSLYSVAGRFLGGLSGFVVDAIGYPLFFLLSAASGIPALMLCFSPATSGTLASRKEEAAPG